MKKITDKSIEKAAKNMRTDFVEKDQNGQEFFNLDESSSIIEPAD